MLDSDIAANTTISTSTNATGTLLDYSGASFANDMELHINGVLMRCGSSSGSDYDVYAAGTAAIGDFACEFNLKQGDVIQQFIGGGAGGRVTHAITLNSYFGATSTTWYTWPATTGPFTETWAAGTGPNSGPPGTGVNYNGCVIPADGTLLNIELNVVQASASLFQYDFEVWKTTPVDGSASGTSTRLANVQFTAPGVANAAQVKTMTLNSTTLLAGDLVNVVQTRRDVFGLAHCRFGMTFRWEES